MLDAEHKAKPNTAESITEDAISGAKALRKEVKAYHGACAGAAFERAARHFRALALRAESAAVDVWRHREERAQKSAERASQYREEAEARIAKESKA